MIDCYDMSTSHVRNITEFMIKQFVDSLEKNICCNKTSFHPTTVGLHQSSGLREKQSSVAYIYLLWGSMHMLRQRCSLSMLHRTCEKIAWACPINLTSLWNFSQVLWSMLRENHCLSMCIEPPRTYIRCWISVLPQTWWSPTAG